MNRSASLSVLPFLAGLVLVLAVVSLAVGKVWVSPWGVFSGEVEAARTFIILDLRLPRTLLAILVGGVLGLAGAVMQGYLRNPLADPGVLGVSACAAFGAVLAIWFGISGLAIWVLPVCAMATAMAGMALLYLLAAETNRVTTFILAGIILNSLAGALTSFAISIAPNPFATAEIVNWMMGALTDRSMDDVLIILPFVALGGGLLLTTGRALDGLSLGEMTARTMGIDLGATHRRILVGVGVSVGATVAVTGIIGFVGLVVPHLLRPFVGERPGALLVPSIFGGSALVLAADTVVRALPGGTEVKLGIVMALLGAPFFLYLLLKMRSQLA